MSRRDATTSPVLEQLKMNEEVHLNEEELIFPLEMELREIAERQLTPFTKEALETSAQAPLPSTNTISFEHRDLESEVLSMTQKIESHLEEKGFTQEEISWMAIDTLVREFLKAETKERRQAAIDRHYMARQMDEKALILSKEIKGKYHQNLMLAVGLVGAGLTVLGGGAGAASKFAPAAIQNVTKAAHKLLSAGGQGSGMVTQAGNVVTQSGMVMPQAYQRQANELAQRSNQELSEQKQNSARNLQDLKSAIQSLHSLVSELLRSSR